MRLFLALLLCAAAAAHAQERYEVISPGSAQSALPVAREFLRFLSEGDIVEAAALSNSPMRRHEVLRDYRASVGEEEFKRVFAEYAARPVVAEIAIGSHRLIIRDLTDAENSLAGQYYVDVDGRFLVDDVPNETRASLKRVLQAYRKNARSSARTD